MDQTKEVHIRVQQRNGRKCITTVSNLNQHINFETVIKYAKERWGCSGVVIPSHEKGKILQLQGNLAEALTEFLVTERLALANNIKVFSSN